MLVDKGADINAKGQNGWTHLHFACMSEQDSIVSKVVDLGADVNARDNENRTPLMLTKSEAAVSKLVEKGADVNAKDNTKWTALHYACAETNDLVVSKLVDLGADVNASDNEGRTPLIVAETEAAVSKLVEKGADVNAVAKDHGWTALHVAVGKENEAGVRLLVDKRADVNAQAKPTMLLWLIEHPGKTPLDVAVDGEKKWRSHALKTSICALLRSNGAVEARQLKLAAPSQAEA